MNQEIINEIKNQIGIITLNSDEGFNTLNRQKLAILAETAVSLDMNDNIKVIIIRGSDKAFSTGLEINDFVSDTSDNRK